MAPAGTTTSYVRAADRTGTLLKEIVPAIGRTSTLVQELAALNKQQANRASRINTARGQIDDLTQHAASAAEQLAATATELRSQAGQLQALMAFFQIKQMARE